MKHFKKVLSLILAVTVFFSLSMPAFADAVEVEPGNERVTIGANLNDSQILSVYDDFKIVRGSVTELKVSNDEERAYLEGLVSEKTIGTRAISCIYIETLKEGKGLDVSTHNISWCTETIYTNALITVGIYDAKVIVTAPFKVSGTAALTGIFKAYEDIAGQKLDEDVKAAGTQEMVVTSELAEDIGDEEATEIVNDLKSILDKTKNMADEQLREEVESIADEHDTTLTDEQIDKLIELVRSLEKLDVSAITDKLNELAGGGGFFASIWEGIKSFFESIGDFFSNLFGGGDDEDESSDVAEPSDESDIDNGENTAEQSDRAEQDDGDTPDDAQVNGAQEDEPANQDPGDTPDDAATSQDDTGGDAEADVAE